MFGTSPVELMAMQAAMQGLVICQAFAYSAVFFGTTALGAAPALVNVPVQIDAGADFVVQRMNLTSWSAVGTLTADPDYLLLLTLNGSAQQLMDQPQTVQNLCGNYTSNKVPADWPFPYVIIANNTLNAQLTNRSAVAANRVDLSYIGFKVKYLQNPDGSPVTRTQVFNIL